VPDLYPQRSTIRILTLGCAVTAAVLYLTMAAAQTPPPEWDGLELRQNRAVDLLYARPGASLEGYRAVRLKPLEVSFDQNWSPNRGSRSTNLTAADFQRIEDALAQEFARVAASELARSGYAIVQRTGPDVLDVQPFIVDLFITAPSTQGAGRSRTFTANAGRMTLVAELRDSETNTILFRVVDRRNASSTGTWQLTTNVSNMGAARQIIQRWAAALRGALDAANGKS
jgi:Protein of unknown function (DUF3313)